MAYPNKKPEFKQEQEFEQKLLEVARVTRVMAGGKRMRFRAALVIGDKKGRVGFGIAKGADVTIAIQKAFNQAKKNVIFIPIVKGTVPHEINAKFNSAKVLIKPAKQGNGIKAGGAVRIVLELSGLSDVTGKILGSSSKINNVKATIGALSSFKLTPEMKLSISQRKEKVNKKNNENNNDKKGPKKFGFFKKRNNDAKDKNKSVDKK